MLDRTRIFDYIDYKFALDYLLEKITRWNTIKSIYQVGSVSFPGLSDIDLLIVMKSNRRDISFRYSIKNLPEDFQYMCSHDGWLIDEKTFKNLHYWFPYFNLNHVYGTELELDETHKDNLTLQSILLVNYLITKVPSDFLLYSCLKGYFYERVMENMVNSLRHSLFLWAKICPAGDRIEYRNFTDEYQLFRKEYFNLSENLRLDKLREYVVSAIMLGYQLIEDMNKYLCANWFGDISLPTEISFKTGDKQLVFKKSFSSEEALSDMLDLVDSPIMYYPIGFGIFLHQYTSSKGIIGRHISACLNGNDELTYELPASVNVIFDQHLKTIEHYAWFHSKKFRFPVNGYHTYWAPHTLSRTHQIVDRIINRLWRSIYNKSLR